MPPRRKTGRQNRIALGKNFLLPTNPYPYMSAVEAMVHVELEQRRVPFSWRYFDGDSAHLSTLMPDFHPEFTLREYRVVIIVLGGFFGTLPSVLDKNALAAALLEADGWTVKLWHEAEIRAGLAELMDREIPALRNPAVRGAMRPNPFGIPDFMARRRAQLAGQGLNRKKFRTDGKDSRVGSRSRRRRPLRRLPRARRRAGL